MKLSNSIINQIGNRARKKVAKSLDIFYGKSHGSYGLIDEVFLAAAVLNKLDVRSPVILDVGANKGDYSENLLKALNADAVIHCFEPSKDHENSLSLLRERYHGRLNVYHVALSSTSGTKILHKDRPGSTLASIYERDIDCFGIVLDQGEEIVSTTLDSWFTLTGTEKINFLKVDVEGHELDVFQGGEKALSTGQIDAIQFEFGGCNIDSRTFIKDFHRLLVRDNGYNLYRIAPEKRLVDLTRYDEHFECFTWQNLIALKSQNMLPGEYCIIHE